MFVVPEEGVLSHGYLWLQKSMIVPTLTQAFTALALLCRLTQAGSNLGLELPLNDDQENRASDDAIGVTSDHGDFQELLRGVKGDVSADISDGVDDLGFNLSETLGSSLFRPNSPLKKTERFKGLKYHSKPLREQYEVEFPLGMSSQPQQVDYVGRRFFDTTGSSVSRATLRAVLMVVLVAIVVAWIAKHAKTYRYVAANLTITRGDQQQLLSQVRQNRRMPQGAEEKKRMESFGDSRSEDRDAHLFNTVWEGRRTEELAAWKLDLVAKLTDARRRLAQLQQLVEAEGALSTNEERGDEDLGAEEPMTHVQAMETTAELELELSHLKRQQRDLKAIIMAQEEIRKNADALRYATMSLSVSNGLGDLLILYKSLVATQHAYEELGDAVRAQKAGELRHKLKRVLSVGKKICGWEQTLSELDLLLEEEWLKAELASTRDKLEKQRMPPVGALAKVSQVTSFLSSSWQGSVQFLWKAVSLLSSTTDDGSYDASHAMRTRATRAKEGHEEQTLEDLQKELADLEEVLETERQVLRQVHSFGIKEYLDWLARKRGQARAAAEHVIATLRNLDQIPPDVAMEIEALRTYSATLELR